MTIPDPPGLRQRDAAGDRLPVVVTLVHGTFGRLPGADAGWTREGSLQRQRLAAELGRDALFLPFRWSGMNWPSARYAAARRLREHFRATAERYPGVGHYVVAHSHGGNVALYALRDAQRDARQDAQRDDAGGALPRGAVCLSTPFIAAQPRPVTLFRFIATYTVVLVTLFAVVATLMGRLLAPWLVAFDGGNAVLRALAWNEVWLEFALCAVLAWYATNALVTLARRRHERIAVGDVAVPIRIVRSVGDEATAVLVTSSLLAWLGTLAWRAASALTLVVTGAFSALLLGALLPPVSVVLLVERLLGGSAVRRRLAAIARSRRALAVVAALGTMISFGAWGYVFAGTRFGALDTSYATAVAALVLAIVAFAALSGLGYGLTAPFLEVTAETTPVGSWEVHLFAARTWTGGDGAGPAAARVAAPAWLSHSAAYVDEGVLDAVAAWICQREAEVAADRPARVAALPVDRTAAAMGRGHPVPDAAR